MDELAWGLVINKGVYKDDDELEEIEKKGTMKQKNDTACC